MDDYYRIAYEYFQTFEGRKLYPKPSWRYVAAVALTVAALYVVWPTGQASQQQVPDWAFVIAFAPLMFVFLSAIAHRKDRLEANAHEAGAESVSEFKRMELARLIHSPSTAFGETALQILELRDLQQITQQHLALGAKHYWTLVYDKGAKDRLMTVAVAGLSVLLALLDKSGVVELPPMFEILGSDGFWHFLTALLTFAALFWLVAVGIVSIARVAIAGLIHVAAVMGWLGMRHPLLLNYLVSDLVRLHEVNACTKSLGTEKRNPARSRAKHLSMSAQGGKRSAIARRHFRRRKKGDLSSP